jgi:hypothetical protein
LEEVSNLILQVFIGRPWAEPSWDGLKAVNSMDGSEILCKNHKTKPGSMERRKSQISPTPKGVPEKLKEPEKPMVCPKKAQG